MTANFSIPLDDSFFKYLNIDPALMPSTEMNKNLVSGLKALIACILNQDIQLLGSSTKNPPEYKVKTESKTLYIQLEKIEFSQIKDCIKGYKKSKALQINSLLRKKLKYTFINNSWVIATIREDLYNYTLEDIIKYLNKNPELSFPIEYIIQIFMDSLLINKRLQEHCFILSNIELSSFCFKVIEKDPNNLKVLLFYTIKKKINFVRNNLVFKQYNIFKSYKKDYDFLKINWLNTNKQGDTKRGRTPFANIKSKKKYLFKFYRIASNDFFKTKFKSHTLTHIYNHIDDNINRDLFKHYRNELCLFIFLNKINFALNLDDSEFLIRNGYVFLNGVVCYNPYLTLNLFDRIQLINCNDEYIQHRFLMSTNTTKKARMWFTIKKLSLTQGRHYKTQPNLRKKWPIKVLWHLSDLPRFVEIDFLTFTAIIIYKPAGHADLLKFLKEDYKPEFFRMYNWKYYY